MRSLTFILAFPLATFACSAVTSEETAVDSAEALSITCAPARPGAFPLTVNSVDGSYVVSDDACLAEGNTLPRGTKVTLTQRPESCQAVALSASVKRTTYRCDVSKGCDPYDRCAIALANCEIYGGDGYYSSYPNPVEACKAAARGPGGVCSKPQGPGPVPVTTVEQVSAALPLRSVTSTATAARINNPQAGKISRCTLTRSN